MMTNNARRSMNYHPNYQPKDRKRFEAMLSVFVTAESREELNRLVLWYALDTSYAREDIMVAVGRIERVKGWA